MQLTPIPPLVPPGGLGALGAVKLTAANQSLLDQAVQVSAGPVVWRQRKLAEARDLLAMSQIAPRLRVEFLDLRQALRALLHLRVPVPCRPPGGDLVIVPGAVLGLTYPEVALRQQQPGLTFIQVLEPKFIWHPNVAYHLIQPLCLGAQLPAGIRGKELVLMAYEALSMQTVTIDEFDAAGLMNPEAAYWWQNTTHRIPLSRIPFLGNDD